MSLELLKQPATLGALEERWKLVVVSKRLHRCPPERSAGALTELRYGRFALRLGLPYLSRFSATLVAYRLCMSTSNAFNCIVYIIVCIVSRNIKLLLSIMRLTKSSSYQQNHQKGSQWGLAESS